MRWAGRWGSIGWRSGSRRRHNARDLEELHGGPHSHRVVGYYALATGAVAQAAATGRVWRTMPEPVPVMLLGRLAVDRAYQERALGAGLRDAILRTLQAAELGGIRAILVHAISDDAKRFYERHCFVKIWPFALG